MNQCWVRSAESILLKDFATFLWKVGLEVAVERETGGDLILGDMGVGLPFRPGSFDGAMSISAIQWLCHANTSAQQPAKRLFRLFTSLYASLVRWVFSNLIILSYRSYFVESREPGRFSILPGKQCPSERYWFYCSYWSFTLIPPPPFIDWIDHSTSYESGVHWWFGCWLSKQQQS